MYVENMLSNPYFLQAFIGEILEYDFIIKEIEICPELPLSQYKADTCVFIKTLSNENYAILIESKLHWPSDAQLNENVGFFEVIHKDYEVIPVHFLFSTENKQIKNAIKTTFNHKVIYLKTFINLYCSVAIKNNFSMSYAYNLHEFINNGNHIPTPNYKVSTKQQFQILKGRSEANQSISVFKLYYDKLLEVFTSTRCNQESIVFIGKIEKYKKSIVYLFPEGDLESSIKIGFHLPVFSQYFGVSIQELRHFLDTSGFASSKDDDWIDFSIKSTAESSTLLDKMADWKKE